MTLAVRKEPFGLHFLTCHGAPSVQREASCRCAQASYGIQVCMGVGLPNYYCHGCAVHTVHRGAAAVADARAAGPGSHPGAPPSAPLPPGTPKAMPAASASAGPPAASAAAPAASEPAPVPQLVTGAWHSLLYLRARSLPIATQLTPPVGVAEVGENAAHMAVSDASST